MDDPCISVVPWTAKTFRRFVARSLPLGSTRGGWPVGMLGSLSRFGLATVSRQKRADSPQTKTQHSKSQCLRSNHRNSRFKVRIDNDLDEHFRFTFAVIGTIAGGPKMCHSAVDNRGSELVITTSSGRRKDKSCERECQVSSGGTNSN